MVVLAVHRVLGDVLEGVVHPAHVPLEAEAQPAGLRGTGDAGEGGGLLRDHHDARGALVRGGGRLLQERDVLEVLAAAVAVGHPLPVLSGVVQVQHRGDRVDPQAVHVELLEPVAGVGDQEVAHLVAAGVEDVGAPVGVLAAAGVRVLVQRGAVEAGERELVLGEVRRDPVHDHADAGVVEGVDQVAQLVGRAEPGGGGVVPGDLVAPGAAEGVLGHRHELHVGEAHLGHVRGQLLGQLPVAQSGPPAGQVDLVDRHPGGQRVVARALGQPVLVGPFEVAVGDHRAGGRRHLRVPGHGVRLLPPDAVGAEEPVLVGLPGPGPRHEELPHAGVAQGAQGVQAPVPAVEGADHLHGAGIGGPDGEGGAVHPLDRAHLGAQSPPELLVAALADQVQVQFADGGPEAVRLLELHRRLAGGPGHPDPVRGQLGRHRGDPDPVVLVLHRDGAAVGQHHLHGRGEGLEGAHGGAAGVLVGAQDRVGVVVAAGRGGAQLVLAQGHHRPCGLAADGGRRCGGVRSLGHVSSPRGG